MLYFLLSYLSYMIQNVSNKTFNKKLENVTNGALLTQNCGGALVATFMLFIFGEFEFLPAVIMVFSVLYGIFCFLALFFLLVSFTIGSVGGSTLLCNTGMFIAAIYGVVFMGDDFSLFLGIAVILMFFSVLLLTSRKDGEKSFNVKWLVFGLLSGLCNAFLGVIKRSVVSIYPDNILLFLAWGYLFTTIAALTAILVSKVRRRECVKVIKTPKLLIYSLFTGFGNAGGSGFQMMALTTVSSAIIYPLTSSSLSVSLWLLSLLIYKETKLSLKNILAVVFCVMAMILMNLKV